MLLLTGAVCSQQSVCFPLPHEVLADTNAQLTSGSHSCLGIRLSSSEMVHNAYVPTRVASVGI